MHDTNKIIYEFFTDDDFLRISEAVKKAEKITSVEIKVSLKEKRNFFERKKTLKDLAATDFAKLKMAKTKEHVGILIFLLLSEKQFYIFADEGINSKIGIEVWEGVRDLMQEKFAKGHFTEGIVAGIYKIAEIAAKDFPIAPDDINELSDAVAID